MTVVGRDVTASRSASTIYQKNLITVTGLCLRPEYGMIDSATGSRPVIEKGLAVFVFTLDDLISASNGRLYSNESNDSFIVHTGNDDVLFVSKGYSNNLYVRPHGSDDIVDANTFFNPNPIGTYYLPSYRDAMDKYGEDSRVIHFSVDPDNLHNFLGSLWRDEGMNPIIPLMDSAEEWAEPRLSDSDSCHVVVVLSGDLAKRPADYISILSPEQHRMASFIAVSTLGDYTALPPQRWGV